MSTCSAQDLALKILESLSHPILGNLSPPPFVINLVSGHDFGGGDQSTCLPPPHVPWFDVFILVLFGAIRCRSDWRHFECTKYSNCIFRYESENLSVKEFHVMNTLDCFGDADC